MYIAPDVAPGGGYAAALRHGDERVALNLISAVALNAGFIAFARKPYRKCNEAQHSVFY